MPIGSTEKAKMVARLAVMRLGASRLGYYLPHLKLTINGTNRASGSYVRVADLRIEDFLDGQPNTCTMRVHDFTPLKGQEVKIGLGSLDPAQLLFAGNIQTVTQFYDADNPKNLAFDLTCISWEWLLNRRKIFKRWTNQSATTIAQDIISGFTSGFTSVFVQPGLATLDEFTCTNEDVTDALDRLARRVGGYWFIDAGRDLNLFTTAAGISHTIDNGNAHTGRKIQATTELKDIATRIVVEGAGSSVLVPIAVGATTIPVESTTGWASASGGTFVHTQQRLTYTGISSVAGAGTTIAGVSLGPSAPSAASAGNQDGRLGVGGAYTYKISFEGAPGESEPSTASGSVTLSAVSAPGAPTAALASGAGRVTAGAHTWKVSFVNANGETLPGTASGSVTAVDFAVPGAASIAAVATTIGNLIGAYGYKVTFVTALGETTGGTLASRTASAQSAPSAPSGSLTDDGPLIGAYAWKVSFVSAIGETMGTASSTLNPAAVTASGFSSTDSTGTGYDYGVSVVGTFGETAVFYGSGSAYHDFGIGRAFGRPSSFPSGATSWKIWRRTTATTNPYRLVAEVPIATTSYTDNIADANLGEQAPILGTMGQRAALTSIATGPTGTLARRIYRTKAGGSSYFLVTEIPDNSTTTYTDTIPDTALTVAPPLQNLNGEQHSLTSIPTGATGTLARRIYRTVAGGSDYKFLTEIGDNSTTSFTDNTPDRDLGSSVPLVNTAGASKISLTSIPTGAAGTTARRIYRTLAGGSVYYRVGTISDNTTTTFTDDVSDNSIQGNALAPTVSTADGGQISLSSIPLGPAGTTKRKIYRTAVGGSQYRYVASISDNVTTTFTDNVADASLGAEAPTVSRWGGSAGNTTLRIADLAVVGSQADTVGGWILVGSQVIRFTGRSASSGEGNLTGIPASGTGSIAASISAGSAAVNAPFLSGVSGVVYAIPAGDDLNLIVTADSGSAQSALAALVGGDGIHEEYIQDRRLSLAEADDRAAAKLTELKDPIVTVTYETQDNTARSGREVSFNLTADFPLSGTFKIQSVTMTNFDPLNRYFPFRQVTASSRRESFEALLRILQRQAA